MDKSEQDTNENKIGELVGATVQALVLGIFLLIAILELLGLSDSAQLFRYQGF